MVYVNGRDSCLGLLDCECRRCCKFRSAIQTVDEKEKRRSAPFASFTLLFALEIAAATLPCAEAIAELADELADAIAFDALIMILDRLDEAAEALLLADEIAAEAEV